MPLGHPWGPMLLGPPLAAPIYSKKDPLIFNVENRRKKLYPPTHLKMKFYVPEPRLKVCVPIFQPPGHCIDGLGLHKINFEGHQRKITDHYILEKIKHSHFIDF